MNNDPNPHAINDETLQYMHSTPFFNMEQQRRYEYLKQVGEEITNIAKQFTIYAELGQKMCTEFKVLRRSFNNMEIIITDSSIKPLSQILKEVDTAFTRHFNLIAQNIVAPLNNFVQKEVEQLTNEEKEYQKNLVSFNLAEEKYVTLKPQTKEKDRLEKENQLAQEHALATLSFFNFCMRMEGIELKLKSHLPKMFMSYITSVSEPFSDCISAMNDKGEELNMTQTTIQEVNHQILEFSNHFITLKQNLSAQIPVFWDRLKVPFSGTTATSIQGFLWKRKSGSFSKSFHRRFFMLSNGILSYAKSADEALKTTKNVPLVFCSVRPEPNAPRMNCFSITSNKRCLFLQALTQWDMNNWVAVIRNSIAQQLNSNAQDKLVRIEINSQSSDGYDDDSDLPPPSAPQVNTICADCGAQNASWVSLNFALTLCDNCVAEHRFLGSRISKVRSLLLDDIDLYQKALAEEAIGTQRANQILEAELNPEEKIGPGVDTHSRRNFIIAKYEKKQFITKPQQAPDKQHQRQIDKENYQGLLDAIKEQSIMDVYKYIIETNILTKSFKNRQQQTHESDSNDSENEANNNQSIPLSSTSKQSDENDTDISIVSNDSITHSSNRLIPTEEEEINNDEDDNNNEKKKKKKGRVKNKGSKSAPSTPKREGHRKRKNKNFFTAVHMAAVTGNPLILSLILLNSNNVDPLDEGGWTPLSYAVYNSLDVIVDILLSFGANPLSSVGSQGNVFNIAKYKQNRLLMVKLDEYRPKDLTPTSSYNPPDPEDNSLKPSKEASSVSSPNITPQIQVEQQEEIKPPHPEYTPEQFEFKNFVQNPNQYLSVKFQEQKKMNASDKRKLNSVIETLRHRLTTHGAGNKGNTHEDTDDYQSA